MLKISARNIKELLNIIYGDDEDYDYIDRRDVLDILNEKLEKMHKLYEYLENCDDDIINVLYDLGDCINLIEEFKNISFDEYKEIEESYSSSSDITFILEHTYVGVKPIRTEIVGFYYGKPNIEHTRQFKDRGVVADYE